jgi:glycerophosphoryl diester phosphodiesterase
MLDPGAFLRPIAHRGLHDARAGRVENTAAAFDAAIGMGSGIECDLRPARGGLPVVFHDETLERLTGTSGRVADLGAGDLRAVRTKDGGHGILTFADFLALVDGRVPLLVEIKSEWDPPDIAFLSEIARSALDYRGDVALMSFDPDVMTVMRELATEIPRGVVSGGYTDEHGEPWWPDRISAERGRRLANLLESGPVAPSFYAYHVTSLPTPVTQYAREVCSLPVFAWTVRSEADRAAARAHADAPIFEVFDA